MRMQQLRSAGSQPHILADLLRMLLSGLHKVRSAIRAGADAQQRSLQVPEAEYEETVNKAAALGRAIDLAEQAFLQISAS